MYSIENLYDMQSVVGARIEKILREREYTKTRFCNDVSISRPTLDKLLCGSITNKTNYEKHIKKILDYLDMSPDMLMGNVKNRYSRSKSLQEKLRIDDISLAQFAGVPVTRLKEIEAGADANIAELRDLALALRTNVRTILGNNYFPIQLSVASYVLKDYDTDKNEQLSGVGFWGHIGILPLGADEYFWYPITTGIRSMVYTMLEQEYLVVPCMNNKVLLLNMKNIKKIVFLDEACDAPSLGNWKCDVDCGEIPLVVYEALDDYWNYEINGEKIPENVISPSFYTFLKEYISEKKIDIEDLLYTTTIYYKNGQEEDVWIDFSCEENISENIELIYDFGELPLNEKFWFYQDINEIETFLNSDIFAFMELPLLEVENKICKELDEI